MTGGDCCHNRSAPFWLFLSRRWLWENTRSAPRPGDGPRATPRAHFLVISLVLADVQLVPLTRLYRSAPRTLPTQSKKKRKRRGRFASASSGSGSTDQGPYRRPVRQSKNKVIFFFFFGFSVHLGQFEWVPALRGPFFFLDYPLCLRLKAFFLFLNRRGARRCKQRVDATGLSFSTCLHAPLACFFSTLYDHGVTAEAPGTWSPVCQFLFGILG